MHKSGCPKREEANVFDDLPKNTQYDHLFVKNVIIPDFDEGDGNGNGNNKEPMVVEVKDDDDDSNVQTLASAAVDKEKEEI